MTTRLKPQHSTDFIFYPMLTRLQQVCVSLILLNKEAILNPNLTVQLLVLLFSMESDEETSVSQLWFVLNLKGTKSS